MTTAESTNGAPVCGAATYPFDGERFNLPYPCKNAKPCALHPAPTKEQEATGAQIAQQVALQEGKRIPGLGAAIARALAHGAAPLLLQSELRLQGWNETLTQRDDARKASEASRLLAADKQEELNTALQAKDAAYRERNQCVALLLRMALALGWRAGVGRHADEPGETWEPDWRTVIFIDLPTGQVSWHFHDSEVELLAGLPAYMGAWDGHDTARKYRRVNLALAGIRYARPPFREERSEFLLEISKAHGKGCGCVYCAEYERDRAARLDAVTISPALVKSK